MKKSEIKVGKTYVVGRGGYGRGRLARVTGEATKVRRLFVWPVEYFNPDGTVFEPNDGFPPPPRPSRDFRHERSIEDWVAEKDAERARKDADADRYRRTNALIEAVAKADDKQKYWTGLSAISAKGYSTLKVTGPVPSLGIDANVFFEGLGGFEPKVSFPEFVIPLDVLEEIARAKGLDIDPDHA